MEFGINRLRASLVKRTRRCCKNQALLHAPGRHCKIRLTEYAPSKAALILHEQVSALKGAYDFFAMPLCAI